MGVVYGQSRDFIPRLVIIGMEILLEDTLGDKTPDVSGVGGGVGQVSDSVDLGRCDGWSRGGEERRL